MVVEDVGSAQVKFVILLAGVGALEVAPNPLDVPVENLD